MLKAVVFKSFTVFDDTTNKQYLFRQGDIIEYERFAACSVASTALPYIRISINDKTLSTPDFIIEQFVQSMSEPTTESDIVSNKGNNKHVHIERCDGTFNSNKFMSNIPREDIIDVKPMENNTYLIIYVKED